MCPPPAPKGPRSWPRKRRCSRTCRCPAGCLAVRPVHPLHRDLVRGAEPGDLRGIGRSPLDPDSQDLLAVRAQPVQQPAVAVRGGLELLGGQVPADAVDACGLVKVAVGVDPANHSYVLCCHAVVCCPSNVHRWEGAGRGRADGQESEGTFGRAPMKSHKPDRPHARRHHPAGRRFHTRTAEASVCRGVRPPSDAMANPHCQSASAQVGEGRAKLTQAVSGGKPSRHVASTDRRLRIRHSGHCPPRRTTHSRSSRRCRMVSRRVVRPNSGR